LLTQNYTEVYDLITYLTNGSSLLNNTIQSDPGFIIGPITRFLGLILNAVFEFAWIFSPAGAHTLGIAIILLTIITRILMLPIAMKQQKSMVATQRLMPEIAKIKEKYGKSKDKAVQQKIAMETQALYSKHKINPLAGCLPALVQLPIFFALNFMIRQAYMFINRIDNIYHNLAVILHGIPNDTGFIPGTFLETIALPKIPSSMMPFELTVENFQKIINKMSLAEWEVVLNNVSVDTRIALEGLLQQKNSIEHFLGLNLIEVSGFSFPGIIIPILTVLLTFASSYLMMKATSKASTDANQQMMQKMMLYMMPIMMGYFTVNFSAGVGIYWITITIIQVVQQYFVNKYYKPKIEAQFNDKIVSVQ
jgi:YidC/Oxa1 family membrane protein insertase